ncbi:hypothetical protein BS17DRAFT_765709 [Gyrodon lividus]|nr:hypothetical protein BS17DRAFT_765709 [Gyrodon lividus]
MGAGTITVGAQDASFAHLIDSRRKWYNNRRIIVLNAWITLLLITSSTNGYDAICFSEYAQHGAPAAGHAVIAFIFLFSAAYDLAFTPLIVSYTVEILPYNLRAKGFNIFSFVISVALTFNQYVNPIALDALGWKYYLVYVCWLAVEFFFLWVFLVETKNRTLEETAALFDGEDALQQISHKAEAHEAHLEASREKSSFPTDNEVSK